LIRLRVRWRLSSRRVIVSNEYSRCDLGGLFLFVSFFSFVSFFARWPSAETAIPASITISEPTNRYLMRSLPQSARQLAQKGTAFGLVSHWGNSTTLDTKKII